MKNKKINIRKKLRKFNDYWSPKVIAEMNDYQFKLAKISGEFIWHHHKSTDEVFYVVEGNMIIEFRDGKVELSEGEIDDQKRFLLNHKLEVLKSLSIN